MLSAFSYAYSTCLSSLVGIQIFCQYFRFFFFFFLLSLDRSPLSNICFAKYFSQSVTCLSTLLGVILIFLNYLFTYIFGCSGSSLPHKGFLLLQCTGFSLQWLFLFRALAPGAQASIVVAHGLSCSPACGVFLDQGLTPCPLHGQVDS